MTFSYQDYKIKISKSVLEQIYQYRQTGSLSSESGGVLIGRQIISTGNLIIDLCTVPMPLDVCKRTRYLRKDPKHIEFLLLYVSVKTIFTHILVNGILIPSSSLLIRPWICATGKGLAKRVPCLTFTLLLEQKLFVFGIIAP